ncbi:MAG: ATP-binding cassette domain-containing protein [Acidimicrobiia bacterium]|nr:ATP-binding cassette domain-containing protein [Acidimicrobiia bacterium]
MKPVLTLDGICKTFTRGANKVAVLDGLELAVAPGEVVIVRGRSGSGKTTLLNILAGWLAPDAGSMKWELSRPEAWEQVAVVPQSLGLLPELTLGENMSFPGRVADEETDVAGVAEKLEISHLLNRPVHGASLGEQQRAAIGRALVRSPSLLLADEPSSHQDLKRLHLVWRLISQVAARGTAAIAATHDPDALRYADRVLDLVDGRLVESDRFPSAQQLYRPRGVFPLNQGDSPG